MRSTGASVYEKLVDRVRAAQLPPAEDRQAIRRQSRATLADLGEALNVSPATILRWERGEAEPRLTHAVAYGRLLNELRDATASTAPAA